MELTCGPPQHAAWSRPATLLRAGLQRLAGLGLISQPMHVVFAAAHVSACGKRRIAAGPMFERYSRWKCSMGDDYEPCSSSDSDDRGCRQRAVGDGGWGRRGMTTLLAGAAAWPLAARAQQPDKTPRVGYIRAGTPNNDPYREEFVRGMHDLGYVEGRNITFEFRHYGDDVESIASHISDLLRAKVEIIVVGGTAAVRAAQAATQSIPIVMGAAADPGGAGLIA